MQVHEWGGVFTDIVTYSHFRQFRPGLRISINSHGGHYWSTQVGSCVQHSRKGKFNFPSFELMWYCHHADAAPLMSAVLLHAHDTPPA